MSNEIKQQYYLWKFHKKCKSPDFSWQRRVHLIHIDGLEIVAKLCRKRYSPYKLLEKSERQNLQQKKEK